MHPTPPLRSADIRPTLQQIRSGLTQVLEDADDAWADICARAGVEPSAPVCDEDRALRVLSEIADLGPLPRVLSTSWRIRYTAARKLEQLGR